MLIANIRSILRIVCICIQIFQIVFSARIDKIHSGCKGKDCYDSDYDDEEAVKNTLLNEIPDHVLNFDQQKNNGFFKGVADPFWVKWFKELKDGSNLVSGEGFNEPEADVIPLCTSIENAEILVLCNSDSEKERACISSKDGSLGWCSNIENKTLAVALCKEKFSDKVISCDQFTKTFFCYPSISHYLEPIRPCREKHRFICLSKDGTLQSCQQNVVLHPREMSLPNMLENPEWEDWWKEWQWNTPEVGQRNPDEVLVRYLCKPKPLNDTLVDCQDDVTKTKACVGITSRKVSECNTFNGSIEVHIPVCTERSTNKVFTCGDFPASFLCFPSSKETTPIQPCRDESRQLCLSYHRLLEKCNELENGTRKKIQAPLEIAASLRAYEEDKEYLSNFEDVVEPLCLHILHKKLVRCNENSSTPFACINMTNGNIQSCRSFQKDIRITICVKNQNAKIMTCDKNAELCFPPEKMTTPFRLCNVTSRMICLSEEGSIMSCTDLETEERQYIGSKKNAIYYYEYDSKIRICQKDNAFLDCFGDKTSMKLVCFEEAKGDIKACVDERPGDRSRPLCYWGDSKEVLQCGLKTKYLCEARHGVKKYIYCNEENRHLCLKEGAIVNCSSIEGSKIAQETSAMDQDSDNKNIDEVYKAENMSIDKIMKNSKPLCKPDSNHQKFESCVEDPNINFACLGIKRGKLQICSKFTNNELIIPICRENSGEVVVCGKFFKANLCSPRNRTSFRISTCNKMERFLCHTKNGILKKCSDKLVKINFTQNMTNSRDTKRTRSNIENKNNRTNKKAKESAGTKCNKSKKKEEKTPEERDDHQIVKHKKLTKDSIGKMYEQYEIIKSRHRKEAGTEGEKRNPQDKHHDGDDIHREGEVEFDEKKLEEINDTEEVKHTKLPTNEFVECNNRSMQLYKKNKKNLVEEKKSDRQDKDAKEDNGDEKRDKYEDESKKSNSGKDEGEAVERENYDYENEQDSIDDEEENREYLIQHVNEITKKDETLTAVVHMLTQHLCTENMKKLKLINCDKDQSHFACIGAIKGNIKACQFFKETEVALAICNQVSTNVLVTCDIVSNSKLCFPKSNKNSQFLTPCLDKTREACLGKNGLPVKCDTLKTQITKSASRIPRHDVKVPTDEKFFRLHCSNCSIESKFVVEGTPDDVHPEVEVFTFSH